MAYFAPYIDATGMHIPSYEDIRNDLVSQMKNIFGSEIYIDEDSMDYQQVSIFAKKIYDSYCLALLTYNNRTPNTAIGVGLDNDCVYVGITRNPATKSIVQLTITGDEGTVIASGQATDGIHFWNLPDSVTIPSGGIITVEATCSDYGNVVAMPNTITTISTPTYGWTSVTNNYSAQNGSDQETDASLRQRFSIATMSPASTVIDALQSAIADVDGIIRYQCYENDTSVTSSEGFPPHSITCVAEGGVDLDIAKAIYYEKTPGCYTNGDQQIELLSESGNVTIIRFYRPTYKNIYLKIYITKLPGYNANTDTDIKNAVVNYIKNLEISEDVYRSIIISTAISQNANLNAPTFTVTSVTTSTDGTTFVDADIIDTFNEAAAIDIAHIEVVYNA